jgi:hypothetical protein
MAGLKKTTKKQQKRIEELERQVENFIKVLEGVKVGEPLRNSIIVGVIVTLVVEAISLLLISAFSVTTKEIHEIYQRVATMEDGFRVFAEKIGMTEEEYGKWEKKLLPNSWMKDLVTEKKQDKEVFNAYLDSMFNILNSIDNVSMPAKREAEKGWFGSGPMDTIRDLANRFVPDMNILPDAWLMEGAPGSKIPSDSSDNESQKEKQNELNEEIKALLGGAINNLIDENYDRAQENSLEKEVPPEKHSGDFQIEKINYDTTPPPTITEADAELIADKIIAKLNDEKAIESKEKTAEEKGLVTTPPVEVVNAVVEEVRAGFENILNAFAASQTNLDPTAGDEKILTVSLTNENSKNISTMIVTQLNEENAIKPMEKTPEGVTNEELGIEVRDSKRSLKNEIDDLKSKIDFLIKLIGKKAMTFDDIYNMLARRMAHDHEMKTGRKIIY